jgi:hypothetical protein
MLGGMLAGWMIAAVASVLVCGTRICPLLHQDEASLREEAALGIGEDAALYLREACRGVDPDTTGSSTPAATIGRITTNAQRVAAVTGAGCQWRGEAAAVAEVARPAATTASPIGGDKSRWANDDLRRLEQYCAAATASCLAVTATTG